MTAYKLVLWLLGVGAVIFVGAAGATVYQVLSPQHALVATAITPGPLPDATLTAPVVTAVAEPQPRSCRYPRPPRRHCQRRRPQSHCRAACRSPVSSLPGPLRCRVVRRTLESLPPGGRRGLWLVARPPIHRPASATVERQVPAFGSADTRLQPPPMSIRATTPMSIRATTPTTPYIGPTHTTGPIVAVLVAMRTVRSSGAENFAIAVGTSPRTVSRVMDALAVVGIIRRTRMPLTTKRGPSMVSYYVNLRIATVLTGEERERAQAAAPPLRI